MDENEIKGAAKDAVGGSAERAGDMANEIAGEISEPGGNATQNVKDTAEAIGNRVYDAGARTGQYVGQTVKQQPLLSLIGAAAIGYALAFLLHAPSSPLTPPVRTQRFF